MSTIQKHGPKAPGSLKAKAQPAAAFKTKPTQGNGHTHEGSGVAMQHGVETHAMVPFGRKGGTTLEKHLKR